MDRNFIIISSIDWSVHWQMHHQLATSLAADGNRVLFIENTGVRKPQIRDVERIVSRIRVRLKSTFGFSQVSDRIYLYSPLFLPFPYSAFATLFNVSLISSALTRWMRHARFTEPIVISFLPTPLAQGLIHAIEPALSIYYCANHMAGSSQATAPLRKWEDKFFASVDLVITISEALSDRARQFARFVYSYPPGVELDKFCSETQSSNVPQDACNLDRPIVGYVGAISDVFDRELIVALARALPHANILLIGPKYSDIEIFKDIRNIVVLDERPHLQMAAYISVFDVALIPYIVNEFTDSVYSCKLNEYLAMGKPVVATDMREVRAFSTRYPGSVLIGRDQADFISKVEQAIVDPHINSAASRQSRIDVARDNSWAMRFKGIGAVTEQHLRLKSQAPVMWKDGLIKYYRRSRGRLLRRAAVILGLYLVVLHSPLVWLIGDQLVVRDQPQPADAIVVFSGDGESSYVNDSYQRRALDAIRYYKQGYAPKVFVSSGKEQSLREVDIIRLFLVDRGVPNSAIHILERYPNSTYQNVRLVDDLLKSSGVKSIILLTSPYHGRRALWTWNKQDPELAVVVPAVTDTPPAAMQWSASPSRFKVIAYEYAAIAYNWTKGRL